MELYYIIKATIYLLMTVTGVVGNTLILLAFSCIRLHEHHLTKSDTILSHLAAANLIVYLTRILPAVFHDYGWKKLFDDASCKIATSVFRVFRGMSICLTCLLSCFQCGILRRTRGNIVDKQKIHNSVNPVILALYLANMAVNTDTAIMTTNPRNISSFKYVFNLGYCLVIYPEKISFEGVGYINFVFDLSFVILMVLASLWILLILHRHRKKMGAIRKNCIPGMSAETKASKTVILLVLFYISFYGIENTIWLAQTISNEVIVMVSDIRVFFTMSYGTVFPIILAICNNKIKACALKLLYNKQEDSNDLKIEIVHLAISQQGPC